MLFQIAAECAARCCADAFQHQGKACGGLIPRLASRCRLPLAAVACRSLLRVADRAEV